MAPRGKKATSQQLGALLKFIKNSDVLRYGKGEPGTKVQCWEELAANVNALGGATKTGEQWKQAYTVWKSHIRLKLRKGEKLNELDEQCSEVAGLKFVTEGNTEIPELGINSVVPEVEKFNKENINNNNVEDEDNPEDWVTEEIIIIPEPNGSSPKVDQTPNKKEVNRKQPKKIIDEHTQAIVKGYSDIAAALNNIAEAIGRVADNMTP